MKRFTKTCCLLLISLSFPTFADKILLTGKPVILIPKATYYRFPDVYTTTPNNDYHFVEIRGDRRVCYLSEEPRLRLLDLLRVTIVEKGKKFLWYCYRYNPAFFEINF